MENFVRRRYLCACRTQRRMDVLRNGSDAAVCAHAIAGRLNDSTAGAEAISNALAASVLDTAGALGTVVVGVIRNFDVRNGCVDGLAMAARRPNGSAVFGSSACERACGPTPDCLRLDRACSSITTAGELGGRKLGSPGGALVGDPAVFGICPAIGGTTGGLDA